MRSQGLTLLRAALRAGAAGAPCANTTTAAAAVAARRAFADDASLAKTALYDYHVAHGGERRRKERGRARCIGPYTSSRRRRRRGAPQQPLAPYNLHKYFFLDIISSRLSSLSPSF